MFILYKKKFDFAALPLSPDILITQIVVRTCQKFLQLSVAVELLADFWTCFHLVFSLFLEECPLFNIVVQYLFQLKVSDLTKSKGASTYKS